ncbi:MAG: LysM peptidoglycan-binding domain-containing protein [Actinomycetota bacterium]
MPAHPSETRELTLEERVERAACMRRHPAGRAMQGNGSPEIKRHTVKDGDTLWDIAAAVLGTEDPAAIARYWPRIHRANRGVIGADPNALVIGRVLVLPAVATERS